MSAINRFSSRRQRLDHAFLSAKLQGAKSYKRIAGYFRSSIFELVGEEIASSGVRLDRRERFYVAFPHAYDPVGDRFNSIQNGSSTLNQAKKVCQTCVVCVSQDLQDECRTEATGLRKFGRPSELITDPGRN